MSSGIGRAARAHVAVFDTDYPTGLAFVRSLGRVGVPTTVYAPRWSSPGRFSRYAHEVRSCPDVTAIDEFIGWMVREMQSGTLGHVAPTSDYLMYNVAQAVSQCGGDHGYRGPTLDALVNCLFKNRFVDAMAAVDFPVPPSGTPATAAEAKELARDFGYPVVIKPRSHVGIGSGPRGTVARDDDELIRRFVPFVIESRCASVLQQDPELALPLVQKYLPPGDVDVVSVSGCLDLKGELLAVSHARKLTQTPPQLGVGTLFEAIPDQPFTDRAIRAVRDVLGNGVFELEVLVDRESGRYWAIDLNPRAFGEISLDVARGNDLPLLWYRSVTGERVPLRPRAVRNVRLWRQAVPFYTAAVVRLARGPQRWAHARHIARILATPSVDATFEWSDPLPGVVHALHWLRHPGGLVRPLLREPIRDELSAGLPGAGSPQSVTLGLADGSSDVRREAPAVDATASIGRSEERSPHEQGWSSPGQDVHGDAPTVDIPNTADGEA
jgi:D-aspartate ligase